MSYQTWCISVPNDLNKLAETKMNTLKMQSRSEYIRYLIRKDLDIMLEK